MEFTFAFFQYLLTLPGLLLCSIFCFQAGQRFLSYKGACIFGVASFFTIYILDTIAFCNAIDLLTL